MTPGQALQIDPTWKGAVRWGGLSLALSAVVPAVFVMFVFILQQTLPLPPKEVLEHPTAPAALFLRAAFGELILMPAGLALYFALKGIGRTPSLIATSLWLLSVPLFLSARGLIIAVANSNNSYLASTDETVKAAYVAAAEITLRTESVYATWALIFLSVASILFGVVMLKGGFGKYIGYLVIAAGAFTIFSPFGVIHMQIPLIIPFTGLLLTAVWQLIVGVKLFKLGKAR